MRWTTRDRLFATSTKKCLGAQGKSVGSEVSLYDCDDSSDLQKWECKNVTMLALKGQQLYIEIKADGTIALSRTVGPNNRLTITGTSSGACSRTYRGTVLKHKTSANMHDCMVGFTKPLILNLMHQVPRNSSLVCARLKSLDEKKMMKKCFTLKNNEQNNTYMKNTSLKTI